MSQYITEILDDIKTNPNSWKDYNGNGIKKDNIVISGYGNGCYLSVVDVFINGKDIPCSYLDKWRLELAIKNWYTSVPLKTLLNI